MASIKSIILYYGCKVKNFESYVKGRNHLLLGA